MQFCYGWRIEISRIVGLFLLLTFGSACVAQSNPNEEKMAIKICPSESTEDAKKALNLRDSDGEISLEALLSRIANKGFEFEKKRYGVSRYNCPDNLVSPNTEVLFIYAGFDETKQYTREFVIITNPDEFIEQIEVRRAYVVPAR